LAALNCASDQACGGQQFQVALNGTDSGSGVTHDLPQVVGLVRVTE
jgi:hypothetical protein